MRTKPKKDKMYVIRKYVKAASVSEAIKRERLAPVHEVYVDEEWRKNNHDNLTTAIGFTVARQPGPDE